MPPGHSVSRQPAHHPFWRRKRKHAGQEYGALCPKIGLQEEDGATDVFFVEKSASMWPRCSRGYYLLKKIGAAFGAAKERFSSLQWPVTGVFITPRGGGGGCLSEKKGGRRLPLFMFDSRMLFVLEPFYHLSFFFCAGCVLLRTGFIVLNGSH